MSERLSINQRVYNAIKASLLDGNFRAGAHLEAAELADGLSASVTPVRIALYRLAVERLLETRVGEGFYVPRPTEFDLRDLYDWIQHLLLLALEIVAERPAFEKNVDPASASVSDEIAGATRHLFQSIADAAVRPEISFAVASANDRLQPFRVLKANLLPDRRDELAAIVALWHQEDFKSLKSALIDYHDRRRRVASDIVRCLHTSPWSPSANGVNLNAARHMS